MLPVFPAIATILSPQALIRDVLPEFDIEPIAQCHFFSGGFNHTYRVTTIADRTYYLRAYRFSWRTFDDIAVEIDVLNHLAQKEFPAPQPVVTKTGDYVVSVPATEGPRHIALFTEVPGPEISYEQQPQETAHEYGEAVARMHNALDDFRSLHHRFHKDIEHFIDKPLINIEPFMQQRPEAWSMIQRFAKVLRERILAMPAHALEQGFCHGDLQGYHANVAPDGTLGFFDFDCGGYGYRAYDLAVFLWCCRLEDAVDDRWQPFLDGYRGVREIRDIDVHAVSLFACARYLWHMGVHARNAHDWGIGFLNDKYFDTHLERIRKAKQDYM